MKALMIKLMFFSTALMSLTILIGGSHPVLISLALAAVAVGAALLSSYLASSWLFYLLMLVFLGGVMVLIIYMSTLCTNEKFVSYQGHEISIFIVALTVLIWGSLSLSGGATLSVAGASLLFESNQMGAMVFLMAYLLMALICIVKVVKFEAGPLTKRL